LTIWIADFITHLRRALPSALRCAWYWFAIRIIIAAHAISPFLCADLFTYCCKRHGSLSLLISQEHFCLQEV
jgi:hypothetical protein